MVGCAGCVMGDELGGWSHEDCSMDLELLGSHQSTSFDLYLKISEKAVRD